MQSVCPQIAGAGAHHNEPVVLHELLSSVVTSMLLGFPVARAVVLSHQPAFLVEKIRYTEKPSVDRIHGTVDPRPGQPSVQHPTGVCFPEGTECQHP